MRTKWFVKKMARKGLIAATYLPLKMLRSLGRSRQRVRILTYHRFGSVPHDPFCVDPAVFDAQIRWLAEQQLGISIDDLVGYLYENRPLPDGAVLVTIDDGYRSTYDIALPILEKYGVPAVSYVSAGIFDGSLDERGGHEPYMVAEELRQLPGRGMAVGSHGLSHRSMAQLPAAEMCREAEESRSILQQLTGTEILSFAYPFGTRKDYSADSQSALQRAGYRIALTSQHEAVRRDSAPLSLPRIKIEGGESLWYFKAICAGGLDLWKYVDRFLFGLQRPLETK